VVAVRAVAEAVLNVDCPDTESRVAVVVARVEVPETARVPCEIKEDVAVIVPPVKVLIVAVTAFRREVKRLVEVALSVTALVA
jgi:hypothetical protein